MSQPRNTSGFTDIQISPLSGTFDLRSTPGTMAFGDFRLVLNASMNELGKRCRRPQWRKYGAGSPYGFNNQDLHDRLNGLTYYCDDGRSDTCPCPTVPECVRLIDYEYGVVLENCVDGVDSSAEEWDGSLPKLGDCIWGFTYGVKSFGGKNVAAILSLKSCAFGIGIWRLEITVQLPDGTGLIVWSGESIGTPVGTYTWTAGCDETPTVSMENCESCTAPVLTASPPSGSVITEGSFISLFATDGALIFFTTDGSTPDNTNEFYTGPFPINSDTTVKAIAYTGTCVSPVSVLSYTVIDSDAFNFEFTCDTEDQSGVFDVFSPNGSSDYNWRLTLNMPEIDVRRIEIYETNTSGVWVTGQSWASVRTIYPVEMNGEPFVTYPSVVFEGDVKLANDYAAVDAFLVESLAEEEHIWMIYGQPFVPLTGYFKLVFVYEEGGEEKTIYSVISHDCGYYYYYDDGGGDETGCETQEEWFAAEDISDFAAPVNTSYLGGTFPPIGCAIRCGINDVVVTHLARWVIPGNSQSHTVLLQGGGSNFTSELGGVYGLSGIDSASVVVDASLASSEGFLYVELDEPFTMLSNRVYFLTSTESEGGDTHYGQGTGAFPFTYDANTVSVNPIATLFGPEFDAIAADDEGKMIGLVNFKYCVDA